MTGMGTAHRQHHLAWSQFLPLLPTWVPGRDNHTEGENQAAAESVGIAWACWGLTLPQDQRRDNLAALLDWLEAQGWLEDLDIQDDSDPGRHVCTEEVLAALLDDPESMFVFCGEVLHRVWDAHYRSGDAQDGNLSRQLSDLLRDLGLDLGDD